MNPPSRTQVSPRWIVAVPLLAIACAGDGETPEWSGTAVGNPGNIGLVATELPEDISLEDATVEVVTLELDPCSEDADVIVEVDASFDLLSTSAWPIELPAGSYCALTVDLDRLDLVGSTDGGTTFDVALAPGLLTIDGSFEVDGDLLLIALPLGDFLDATELEALGAEVILDPDDDLALDWSDLLSVELWEDSDGDGEISFEGDEQLASVLGEDTSSADGVAAYESGEQSSGCNAVPVALGLWWIGALLACRRRQR